MSVITAEDTGLDIEDEAEIEFDDEEVAKQLSGDIRGGRHQGGGSVARQQQQHRGLGGVQAQMQRSVTSDSMGMTAEIEDFLMDSDEEASVGGGGGGGYGRSQSMRPGSGAGVSASSYLRSYTSRR